MRTISLIVLGFLLAVVVHAAKVWTFHEQFTDPVPTSKCAEWEDHYYFDTETWSIGFNWTCRLPRTVDYRGLGGHLLGTRECFDVLMNDDSEKGYYEWNTCWGPLN